MCRAAACTRRHESGGKEPPAGSVTVNPRTTLIPQNASFPCFCVRLTLTFRKIGSCNFKKRAAKQVSKISADQVALGDCAPRWCRREEFHLPPQPQTGRASFQASGFPDVSSQRLAAVLSLWHARHRIWTFVGTLACCKLAKRFTGTIWSASEFPQVTRTPHFLQR